MPETLTGRQVEPGSPETRIAAMLSERGQTLSVAESCTGGRIASRLTALPGSSRYFESGYVTYSNASKIRVLGVSVSLIKEKGAVSREVASAMAEGVRRQAGVDFSLAATGVAGPAGGSAEKPLGLVYIALADDKQCNVVECHFEGKRDVIQSDATTRALEILVKYLKDGEIYASS